MFDNIIKMLKELRETTKRNDKINILAQYAYKDGVSTYLFYALNYRYVYHVQKTTIKKAYKMIDSVDTIDINERNVYSFIDDLKSREISGNNAIEQIARYLKSMNEKEQDTFECLLLKDLKAGVNIKTVNKAFQIAKLDDNFIPEFNVPLANKWNDYKHNISYPCIVQTKYDGLRMIAQVDDNGNLQCYTRNGLSIPLNHFNNHFNDYHKNMCYDGELLISDEHGSYLPRKEANGIINSIIKGKGEIPEGKTLVYVVFDVVSITEFENENCSKPYTDRLKDVHVHLSKIENTHDAVIVVPDTHYANDENEVFIHLDNHLKRGLEGVIVKDTNMLYKKKRLNDMLKLKAENDMDLVVKDVIEGDGKYSGMMGALVCESEDGEIKVNVGTGFNDDDRKWFWRNRENIIGKMIEVKYNEIIENEAGEKSLFLPVYHVLRFDKE